MDPEAQLRLIEWMCFLQKELLGAKDVQPVTDLSAAKGVPLDVATLGIGSHGSAIRYTDVKGIFSSRSTPEPVSIVLKIHEDDDKIDNVPDYEIYVARLLSDLCRGSPLNVYQTSPHIVRVFGGMDAVWYVNGQKLVKRAMVMEPVTSPLDVSSLKDLLYAMRDSKEASEERLDAPHSLSSHLHAGRVGATLPPQRLDAHERRPSSPFTQEAKGRLRLRPAPGRGIHSLLSHGCQAGDAL